MAKNHLARLASPRAWPIKRRGTEFITRQNAGPHSAKLSIPLNILLKELIFRAATTNEARKILNSKEVKIDGKVRKDFRFPVGIFDTIEFPNTNECFRVILDKKGKLMAVKIKKEEAPLKPAKIIGKTMVRGKLQLNLYDARNMLVSNNIYRTGDTLLLSLPGQKITKHLRLEKKSAIFLIGGRHIGEIGTVEDVGINKIIYKDAKGNLIETSKKYAFVIGDTKPMVTIE